MPKTRPPIAADFKHLAAPRGFRNINEIGDLSNRNWLHPVQSLYGNWRGSGLILGQDFNSWNNIRDLSPEDLRHDDNFSTNKTIVEIFGPAFSGIYANYFWFIKSGDSASSHFSTRREVIDANRPIFDATLRSMPNLKVIFCLGGKTFSAAFGKKWAPLKTWEMSLLGRDFTVVTLPHLGALGLNNFCSREKITQKEAITKIKKIVSRIHEHGRH